MQPRDTRDESTQLYQSEQATRDEPREQVYRDELAFGARQDDERGRSGEDEVARGQAAVPDVAQTPAQPATVAPTPAQATAAAPVPGQAAPAAPDQAAMGTRDAQPEGGLWGDGASEQYEVRWREIQLHFVDDPQAATTEAEELVEELSEAFGTALASQRRSLAQWHATEGGDTEKMRVTLTRYHDLLERLLHV